VFQIAFLGTFLTLGVLVRDFTIAWHQVALTFAGTLATQAFWLHRLRLHGVGYLSAVVTGFGLSILVRADNDWVHPLVACAAISAKFVLRVDGRHVFNPANLGAFLAAIVLPGAWVSPGQWGQDLLLAGWFLALGTIVTQRSRRLDAGWTFLAIYVGLVGLRVLALGQPAGVIAHQVQSGALLLFAFFMISDPPTTPRAPRARVLYACLVALAALAWQFGMNRPNGLVIALFVLSPLVLAIDRVFPGPAFRWRATADGDTGLRTAPAGPSVPRALAGSEPGSIPGPAASSAAVPDVRGPSDGLLANPR
jgi:Na+-transporting NADH:ubiquinone oxidoreductase subunit NqrB